MYEVVCYDSNGDAINHLTQWDKNQIIYIKNLTIAELNSPEFHFATKNSTKALVKEATINDDNSISAAIPDVLLEEGTTIFAYLFMFNEDNSTAKTLIKIKIPVQARVEPEGYEHAENNTPIISPLVLERIESNIENINNQIIDIINDISNIDTKDYYKSSIPSTVSVGGIEKGTVYNSNTLITKIIDDMLHPYVAPTINSASISSPTTTVYEKGVSASIVSVSISVIKGSKNIVKEELLNGSNIIKTFTSTYSNGGTIVLSNVNFSIQSDTTITVRITDADNKSYSKNTNTISFVYPYYYGVINDTDIVSSNIVSNLSKLTQTKGTKILNYDLVNQKMVFASQYKISKITDQNGFDNTNSFEETTVSITGTDKTTQLYYVYTLRQAVTGSFTMTFIH